MWNSNSIIVWLIARCGLPAESITPQPVGAPQVGMLGSSWRVANGRCPILSVSGRRLRE
jgi:hypothetical protein